MSWSQRHAPATLPAGILRYSLYKGWMGFRAGLDGRPSPGFDSRIVQSKASRYTDWAIPAHLEALFTPVRLLLCVFVLQFVNSQLILTSTAVRSIHSELVNQSINSTICLHLMFQLLSALAVSVDVKRLLAATATYVFSTLAEMDIRWAES